MVVVGGWWVVVIMRRAAGGAGRHTTIHQNVVVKNPSAKLFEHKNASGLKVILCSSPYQRHFSV